MKKTPTESTPAITKTQPGSAQKTGGAKSNDPRLLSFFTDELKDIYWAEKHLAKALPKLEKAAGNEQLKQAISDHQKQTQEHVTRLEDVFKMLNEKPQAKKCDAMEGLLAEADSITEDTEEGSATRDVGVILAAQKVEHYEIATYGVLATLAKTLGLDDAAAVLAQTLEEEKQADRLLTDLAENDINYQAAEEGVENIA
jgi:ferritin-like metal-binding protein YciE